MYLLEKFHLVQFFLFRAETLSFSPATGIVAPNGSGKSAILDAMQIVLYGGDQNQIDLNAQSGGVSGTRGRSVREYCLGYYRGDEHIRENATSYLTMVFRDTEGELPPVSVGLALGASVGDPKLHVYGRYVVQGVALALDDHLEANAEAELLPLAWGTFNKLMEDAVSRVNGRLAVPPSAEKQVEAMLFALRPKGGGSIDPRAFRRAMKNALNLQKVPDTSSFVRNYIVDAHPIELKNFRSQLDNLRSLQAKVLETLDRLENVKSLIAAGHKATQTRMHAATYRALLDDYEREQHMDAVDAAQTTLHEARDRHQAAQNAVDSAKAEHDRLNGVHIELELQSAADPAISAARDLASERERSLRPIKTNVAQALREVVAGFEKANRVKPDLGGWQHLAMPWVELLDAVSSTSVSDALVLDVSQASAALRESSMRVAPIIQSARRQLDHDEQRLSKLGNELRIANEQIKRIQEGKAELPPAVQAVVNILGDKGLLCTPVCDLVTVTDADWAPVIEGFLGRSRTALVVRSGKFEDALSVFNKIPWDTKPDSVLLVNPVKSKADMGVVPPMGLAHLIAGDNQVAVDYIRLRHGRLERLERVTTDSPEGFTRTGEQAGRADFGRRRPLSATELVLGRQDASHRLAVLRQQRSTLGQNAAECEQEANRSRQLVEALEKLVGLEGRIQDIERWLNSHIQEQSALDAKAAMQEIASAPDLLARQLLITEARRAALAAQSKLEESSRDVGTHGEAFRQAQRRLDELADRTNGICSKAALSRRNEYVGDEWFETKRDEFDGSGLSLHTIVAKISDATVRSGNQLSSQVQALASDMSTYANQFDPQMDIAVGDLGAMCETMAQEKQRLEESELHHYQVLSAEAAEAAEQTFKVQIAARLSDHFASMRSTLNELNSTMERLPPFSNNEKYHFVTNLNKDHESLYKFILKVAGAGPEGDIFSGQVDAPPEFRAMLEGKDAEANRLLEDYRNFFNFEIDVRSNGVTVTDFSKRMDKGSGGEHRAPLFIVAAASMARALGKLRGDQGGMSLIIFDELGDKIDSVNTRAVFEYLKALGLQPIVAAPDDALGKINESVDTYIEMYRDDDLISIKHVRIDDDGHVILDSDNWRKHPELLEEELKRVEASRMPHGEGVVA
ncbi:TPA: AAA family ATPase [Stenotrophomonas maltophilia]|nr:AAA family ATPase [Stenotrophomonas maltophilia]HDS1110880.1 AAA family ATPase [Stenotrophomonas maltophilia]HDS1122143.1 AAA family ATPase [Stenotrophomonas maltophilia]